MAISLGWHIIFACIGMAMPFFMAYAEWKWIKTKEDVYLDLAKSWSKGVAIFFAVGAVSGTLLSFELGLLWPTFMEHAGPIFGMPFSLEGTAFFVEAIALGVFLYGWDKISPMAHWFSGLLVGISGVMSGIFVVAANAWMNSPSGFDIINGEYVNIDPIAALFNDAWFTQALHMTFAVVHFAFQIMVGLGSLMMLIGLFYFFMRWRKWDYINNKWWLRTLALATPIGFIALEAGWTVTEVGRQPWIIYGVMKTKEALTPMPGIQYSLLVIVSVYFILTLAVIWLMARQIKSIHQKYKA